jgi:DNA-binding XRE family transcriptional regulator
MSADRKSVGVLVETLSDPKLGENENSNNVQHLREERLMSKAELARRAGVSVLTIDRVERGQNCRLDTKRKIILALGLKVQDKDKVFTD